MKQGAAPASTTPTDVQAAEKRGGASPGALSYTHSALFAGLHCQLDNAWLGLQILVYGLRSSTHMRRLFHVVCIMCGGSSAQLSHVHRICWCAELCLMMQLWVDPSLADLPVPMTGLVAPMADLPVPTTGLVAPTAAHQAPTADHQQPMPTTGLADPMVPHQAPAHLVPTAAHQEQTPTPGPVAPTAAPPAPTAAHLQATAGLLQCRTTLPGAPAPRPAPALPPRPRTVRARRLHLYEVLASFRLALIASFRPSVPHFLAGIPCAWRLHWCSMHADAQRSMSWW